MMNKNNGMTMIEMVIVIAILATLAAIAYPSYQKYIKKGRLRDAQQALLKNIASLDQQYAQKLTFKKNNNQWIDLPHTQTPFFCIKMQGTPKSGDTGTFTMKAVAFDKTQEPRVLKIDQDHRIQICESSDSVCDGSPYFVAGHGRVDKNCLPFD